MKKLAILIGACMVLGLVGVAFAQEFPDVPPDHWAYDAIQKLVDAGIIIGYPDGTFSGKRAMTRYEFAEALARAISSLGEGKQGPAGPAGPPGPAGPAGPPGPAGPGTEQVAALQKMVDEFKDELASLGVDVEALRRDLAALNDRVTALEEEQARVRWTGTANLIALGDVRNSGDAVDKDSRELAMLNTIDDTSRKNPLAESRVLPDLELGIAGKVGETMTAKATIVAGDYLDYALNVDDSEDIGFTLWNAYLEGAVKLGPLGNAQIAVGRYPFQLTPLTLKFVDPDIYNNVDILDSGNFLLDGGSAMFNLGRLNLTAFAGKAVDSISDALTPDLAGDALNVAQIGGIRATIGITAEGTLGLTYYQAGLQPTKGVQQVYGADLNLPLGGRLGLAAEYAQTSPNDTLKGVNSALDDNNSAWNAKLTWQTGNLALAGGFSTIEQNYNAPGYWSRLGRAVNLRNVQGPMASLTYSLTDKLCVAAEGQFLEPDKEQVAVLGRSAISNLDKVSASGLDKITYWRAGLKYGVSSANSIDLGVEQVTWEPTSGVDTEERYITVGVGHSFNPNASLRLLYQIIEYEDGTVSPYVGTSANYRGGKATAQFQLKF